MVLNPSTHAVLGVAVAVHALLDGLSQTAQPLRSFDERIYPLGGPPLVGSVHALCGYVLLLARVLGADAHQLVVALVLFEGAIRARPGSLRLHSTRPLLLAAVLVALKITLDETLVLSDVTARLEVATPALTPRHLMHLEGALLTVLGCVAASFHNRQNPPPSALPHPRALSNPLARWRLPIDSAAEHGVYQRYATELFAAADAASSSSVPAPSMLAF